VVRDLSCGDLQIYLALAIRRVKCDRCGKVKSERLTWLADNPFYTKRFAFSVGRRCRAATIRDVANGWLDRLRNDKTLIVQAAAQAQKAADFILDRPFNEAEQP
jgi:transposase